MVAPMIKSIRSFKKCFNILEQQGYEIIGYY